MREIKFRTWDKIENKMWNNVGLVGTLVILEHEQSGYDFLDVYLKNYDTSDEQYYQIMQYTGLKDRNGAEIYEGDIFKDDENFFWEISYESGMFIAKCHDLGAEKFILEVVDDEIIGNKFEHPHLLAGEDE